MRRMEKKNKTVFEDIVQGLNEAIAYENNTSTARVMLYEGYKEHGRNLVMDKRGMKAEIEAEEAKLNQ